MGNRYYYAKCARSLQKLFARRISNSTKDPMTLKNNYADWSITNAVKSHDPVEQSTDVLSRRLMALNFAAIHTSTMTITNLIMDIACGRNFEKCMAAILVEGRSLRQRYHQKWDLPRLTELSVLDSALRESMRYSTFNSKAFARKIVAPDGLLLPSGETLPTGIVICISGYAMHHDEDLYSDPANYKYDRFLVTDQENKEDKSTEHRLAKSAVTTDTSFGGWGHGKHACPGRFFAVALAKLTVSLLLEKYDIEPWTERPSNIWIAGAPIPHRGVQMRIRRRL